MRGIGGVGYIGGGKWTGSLTTLGPSPGSQHFHWFPLRSDLPGPRPSIYIYTFGTIFHGQFAHLYLCCLIAIFTCNVKTYYTEVSWYSLEQNIFLKF